MQWLMFQMGKWSDDGTGNVFSADRRTKRTCGTLFYRALCQRISKIALEVLNTRLEGRTYWWEIAYSIADMAMYPWARCFYWAKVSVDGLEHLQAWFDRIDARPRTQRSLEIPEPFVAFFGKGDIATSEAKNASRF